MSGMRCMMCGFRAPEGVFAVKGDRVLCPKCRGPSVPIEPEAVGQEMQDPTNPFLQASFFGVVTTPQDVRNEKEDINPYVQSLDAAVESCRASLSPATIAGWKNWRVSWLHFYGDKSSLASASGDLARARGFRAELQTWHDQIAQACPNLVEIPTQSTAQPPASTAATWWDKLNATGQRWATVTMIAAAVGGVVVIYLLYQSAKTAREVAPQVLDKVKVIPVPI